MQTTKLALFLSSLGLAILLTGCAGSNSMSTSTPPPTGNQAPGVYQGTLSNGDSFEAIVAPNDDLFAIYGTTSGATLTINGFINGPGQENGNTYSVTTNDFYYTGSVITGTLTGTIAAGASLNGTITEGSTSLTFTDTVPPTSTFNYNTAANLSSVTGTWSGFLLDGETATVTIDSSGAISGLSQFGCSFTGTAAADSSGKNFFDVSLTFGGAPCLIAGGTATGIAIDALLSDGTTHELLAGVTTGAKSAGTVFIGTLSAAAKPAWPGEKQ